MGNSQDPITLHKYMYANADPVSYTDPTGNFSLGQTLSAINTISNLVTTAQATYNLLEGVATGEGELTAKDAGIAFLTAVAGGAAGKLLKLLSKSCKSRARCKYLAGAAMAKAKMHALVARTPNSRLRRGSRNRVIVVSAAFDIKKGRGTAAFNGGSNEMGTSSNPALLNRIRRHGYKVGTRIQCSTTGLNISPGRCAEFGSALNLLRSGSRLKNIRWLSARYVDRNPATGFAQLGNRLGACDVCQTIGAN